MGTVKKRDHRKRHLKGSEEIMTSRTLLFLVIAAGIGVLNVYNPRAAETILMSTTFLAVLVKLIS